MAYDSDNSMRAPGGRMPADASPLVPALAESLHDLYDPVAQASLPLHFGRPLGWLHFLTSHPGGLAGGFVCDNPFTKPSDFTRVPD